MNHLLRKIVLITCYLGLLASCAPKPRYITLGTDLIETYAYQSADEGLVLSYGGMTAAENDIEQFALVFTCNATMPLDQARELLVRKEHELLWMINYNEEIRPYLHHYPFSAKNIAFVIIFLNAHRPFVANKDLIANVCSSPKGLITYDKVDPSPNGNLWITIHEETFEEAERIVRSRNQNLAQRHRF